MILAPILTAAEILINPLLQMDETTLQRLTSIEGKLIQVEVIDWQIIYGIVPHQSGVQLLSKIEGRQADCRIRGKLMDLCQVFCNRGSTPALFKQSIDIEGDPELAEKIHEIMQKLDIDWEGLSTHVFGDLLGMQVAKQISDFTAVAKQTCQT